MRLAAFILLTTIGTLNAGNIVIADASAYVHGNGGLIAQYGQASPTFFSNLNGNNLGTFGWTFTNTTGSTINDAKLFGFLDADINRDLNTFFNEYGFFLGLSLPATAPAGAIAASSWQIDEPGFVFGTILNDLAAGSLQNANFVSSATPDDVSLALGFQIGFLAPGQMATLTLQISPTDIAGLQQLDPDSNSSFYLNGYGTTGPAGPASDTPEPGTWALCAMGVGVILLSRKR